MIGGDGIGFHAVAEMLIGSGTPVYYNPVSRIQAGGGIAKPAQLAVLGVDILWDSEDFITWDDDTSIGWEA